MAGFSALVGAPAAGSTTMVFCFMWANPPPVLLPQPRAVPPRATRLQLRLYVNFSPSSRLKFRELDVSTPAPRTPFFLNRWTRWCPIRPPAPVKRIRASTSRKLPFHGLDEALILAEVEEREQAKVWIRKGKGCVGILSTWVCKCLHCCVIVDRGSELSTCVVSAFRRARVDSKLHVRG